MLLWLSWGNYQPKLTTAINGKWLIIIPDFPLKLRKSAGNKLDTVFGRMFFGGGYFWGKFFWRGRKKEEEEEGGGGRRIAFRRFFSEEFFKDEHNPERMSSRGKKYSLASFLSLKKQVTGKISPHILGKYCKNLINFNFIPIIFILRINISLKSEFIL